MIAKSRIASRTAAVLLGSMLLSWGVDSAAASSPQLDVILPRGVQRGGEHELIFGGQRLTATEEVFLYDSGVEVLGIEVLSDSQVKVRVRVTADCRLGEQLVQLRTAGGISEFRSFFVGALPAIDEKEPNGALEEAQPIEMNVTVAGVVDNEDVDFYRVSLKAQDRLSVEVEGLRLGTTLFDPYIAILDSRRFELAAVDDSPAVQQDGVLSVVVPEDGDYYVQIRESSYGGNGGCRYRLHIGSFPRPTAVYPAGGRAGETAEVRFVGDARGDLVRSVAIPSVSDHRFGIFAEDEGGIAPSGIPFRVTAMGNVLESEPNDDFAAATPAAVTEAFNGIVERPGDVDVFRFSAEQGQTFELECFARRIRSGLDPVINVYKADGSGLAGNDDARGPDSYLRFQAPETGEYLVRVTDHLGRGAPDFVYRLEFQPLVPSLMLGIPRIDRYSQTRQTLMIPRGNRYAVLLSANRVNFGGALEIETTELLPGVTMHAQPMADNLAVMPVVLEAAADAPLGGKLVEFTARHVDPATGIRGHFVNDSDFVLGPPNNAVYYSGHVEKLAVAVVEEVPFKLEIVQPQVPIVHDGVMDLRIRVERRDGFAQPIVVEFPFRSPGIGAPSSITIPAEASEGVYTLNAAGNAQVGEWPMYVIGQAQVAATAEGEQPASGIRRRTQGIAYVASQLATLRVAAPYVMAEVPRASGEQGQEIQVFGKFTFVEGFEGTATATLVGLPPNSTAEPLTIDPSKPELAFTVKTTAEVPVGKHKSPFIEIAYVLNGETVKSVTGRFELQIDAPLPQETAPAEPMPQAAPMPEPAAPTAKPLSRLEKLRLEAQQRGGGGS